MISRITLFLVLLLSSCSFSQDTNQLKKGQLKRLGRSSYNKGQYHQAIRFIEPYLKQKEKLSFQIMLSKSYYKVREYEKCLNLTSSILSQNESLNSELLLQKIKVSMVMGDYDPAKQDLLRLKKLVKGDKKEKFYKKLIKAYIMGCDSINTWKAYPIELQNVSVSNEVNMDHIEFSPDFINDSTLLYSSLRTNLDYTNVNDSVVFPLRGLYEATFNSSGIVFVKEVNGISDTLYNISGGGVSLDERTYYFSKCANNILGTVHCEIYSATYSEEGWSKIEKLPSPLNSTKYSASHVSPAYDLSKGHLILYFSSDRPGGRGGKDLWYSEYNERKKVFKEPKNCGAKINSVGDEITPFYDQEKQTLYYSSDGLHTMGGLDIFLNQGEKKKWVKTINAGYPINSSADDLSFSKRKNVVLLTSNRPQWESLSGGICCDDIYCFKLGAKPEVELRFKTNSFESDKETLITIYKKDSAGYYTVKKIYQHKEYVSSNFDKDSDYKVVFEKKDYLRKTIYVNSNQDSTFQYELEKIPSKAIILKNINYDFDSDALTDSSFFAIDKYLLPLLNDNPEIRIQIGSHSDSKGNDKYNLNLSQRRAESVVKYLISQNIDKSRLEAKGYGETTPIAPNTHPDGSDNPEGRAKNRRTEFLILSSDSDD